MLFRNIGDTVMVVKDDQVAKQVANRGTITWPCGSSQDHGAMILVQTKRNDIIYNDYLECGDALYVSKEN